MTDTHGTPEEHEPLNPKYDERQSKITILRGGSNDGYPKPESIWSGLPIWILALLQWITGLLTATMLAAITALFWPVAAIYYHAIFRSHKTVQAILAVTGFIAAIIFYPLVFAILLIIAMVLWVLWIIKDAAAIEAHSIRPKIGPEYLLGLPVFAD